MKRNFAILIGFSLVFLYGYRWYSHRQTDQFVKEQIAMFSGYRLEHLNNERLLFLHLPDGTHKGFNLASLRLVHLYRQNPADSTNNKNNYSWRLVSATEDLAVPYFAIRPEVILQILKEEHPEISTEWALKKANEFERNEFNLCTIWKKEGGDFSSEKGYNEYGYNYCER